MRDDTKLRVFEMADNLALRIYKHSQQMPRTEQFGLAAQVRRSAVSVASNLVEGCARRTEAEYLRFIEIAYGSARELQYQVSLSSRLGFFTEKAANELTADCAALTKTLNTLIRSFER